MTKWSKFWTLKVFETVLHWLYQTKKLIKVTPKRQKKPPQCQWLIKETLSKYDTLHLHIKSLKLEIVCMVNKVVYTIEIVKYSKW